MNNLIYKEFKITVHKFFLILPILTGLLLFIPNWIFTIVFMYFFWISIPQIYSLYITKNDHSFNAMLPVSKREIVLSKIYTLYILEAIHLVIGIVFGIIHNSIYGQWNYFFDINTSFFGFMILMYAVFNSVFLPQYFKTGYYFGKPLIKSIVVILIYGFVLEYVVTTSQKAQQILEGPLVIQLVGFILCIALAVVLSIVTIKKSIQNFERIK